MEQPSIPKKYKLIFAGTLILALVAFGLTAFMWIRLQNGPVPATSDETAKIVAEVGKHLMLPQGEEPELLTVSDLSQVQGQPFFANALVGDKVLVYKQAAKAVLWRPLTEKIVEVYPINLSAQ